MIDVKTTVHEAAAGNEEAWADLVTMHRVMLEAIGRNYRLGPEYVQDAVQETWLALYRSISSVREPEHIGGWLAVTMRRNCLRIRNRYSAEMPQDATAMTVVLDQTCSDVADFLLAKERTAQLAHALEMLTPRQREVVKALAEDASYKALGADLRMPHGSIGPTRARALHQLRALLAQDDITYAEAI